MVGGTATQVSRTSSSRRGLCTGAIGELSKWSAGADQDGKQEADSDDGVRRVITQM